jgi:Glyoxalase-like domain
VTGSTVDAVNFDCGDPKLLADFWCAAIDYEISDSDETGFAIRDPAGKGWDLLFLIVPEGKAAKNRLHLDLIPPTTMKEEVARLTALGATEQRLVEEEGSRWTVMLDPEGNEFCVLRSQSERATPSPGQGSEDG